MLARARLDELHEFFAEETRCPKKLVIPAAGWKDVWPS